MVKVKDLATPWEWETYQGIRFKWNGNVYEFTKVPVKNEGEGFEITEVVREVIDKSRTLHPSLNTVIKYMHDCEVIQECQQDT